MPLTKKVKEKLPISLSMLTNSVTSQRKKVLSQITPKPCCRPGEESSGESLREKAELIFLLVHSLYNSQTFKKKQRELVGSIRSSSVKFSISILYHSG